MKDKEKTITIIVVIIIIFCVILAIIGIFIIIESMTKRDNWTIFKYILTIPSGGNESVLFVLLLINKYMRPYLPTFAGGIVMTIIGILGIIISIIIYIIYIYPTSPKHKSNVKGKQPFKTISRYIIKSGKRLSISRCPGCKAPLKKIPPCECEYCGSIIK